ncbi:MAG: hypothetical protein QXS51_05955 [Thermoproteota archaeon]|nr:hypothetical protein [Candidatus Brockarchaeota archaeon]
MAEVTVAKVKELFDPEDELVFIRVGDVYIVEKLDYVRILERMRVKFKDLSEEEKEKIALEAKKWARIK